MKYWIITGFSGLIFGFSAAMPAQACSCVPEDESLTVNQRVARSVADSRAVFSAKIVGVKKDDTSRQQITFRVEVLRVWKGRVPTFTTVSTGSNSAMCGYGFTVGETYLIYAGGKASDGFSTTHCTRTAGFRETPDIKHLGKGRKPRAGRGKG